MGKQNQNLASTSFVLPKTIEHVSSAKIGAHTHMETTRKHVHTKRSSSVKKVHSGIREEKDC